MLRLKFLCIKLMYGLLLACEYPCVQLLCKSVVDAILAVFLLTGLRLEGGLDKGRTLFLFVFMFSRTKFVLPTFAENGRAVLRPLKGKATAKGDGSDSALCVARLVESTFFFGCGSTSIVGSLGRNVEL